MKTASWKTKNRGEVTPALINLLVLSEQKQLADKLHAHIGYDSGFKIVDGLLTPSQCFSDRLRQAAPDLILIDSTSANETLNECLSTIRRNDMTVNIILLIDQEMPNFAAKIVQFNIHGLVQLNASRNIYLEAIHGVHKGEIWLPRSMVKQIFMNFLALSQCTDSNSTLTAREQMIIQLVQLGKTNKQVALMLFVSPETIKKHMKNIFNKLGIQRRSSLNSKNLTKI